MGRMADLSVEEGAVLVRLARQSIMDAYERKDTPLPKDLPKLMEKRGVFVTLNTWPSEELRGCIGFVRPDRPLNEAVAEAARFAAFSDGRFAPVEKSEMGSIVIEVSVLSVPKPISAEDMAGRLKAVHIGTDGLILQYGRASGLLLPQVAIEWNFTPQTFLEAICEKAGMPKDMWKSPSAKLWTFGAEIYAEKKPAGASARRPLIR
ncbi:Uncharacterised protein [uncultured archaeon]|nr:Uncharacterised protein [uncultured archaeon]